MTKIETGHPMMGAIEELKAVQAQRDELLAALKQLLWGLDINGWIDGEVSVRQFINAVITKAEVAK